jgi:Coenzyme PQQ synthesis protein D (PqqD)
MPAVPELEPLAIGADFVPTRAHSVYTVEIDGEAVLLEEVANRLHHLNHTATLLWACFDGHASAGELAAEICEELGLPYETVLADTVAVLRELGSEGLLDGVRADDPEAAASG